MSYELVDRMTVVIPDEGIDLNKTLDDIAVRMIGQAMTIKRGNKSEAAKLLRINRTTLVEKLKRIKN